MNELVELVENQRERHRKEKGQTFNRKKARKLIPIINLLRPAKRLPLKKNLKKNKFLTFFLFSSFFFNREQL